MTRRSFFQRLGTFTGACVVGDRAAAQQLCDQVGVRQPPSIDEMHARMVIGNGAWNVVAKVAPSFTTVLVRGEPGSGLTLAARVVHARSSWADAPLLTVDCSMPGTIGRAWSVTPGTLVLENVTALNMFEQKQLLKWMCADYRPHRVICTTPPMRSSLVDRGIFSEELYYRLNVVSLALLPLRERPDVILPLAAYAVTRAAAAQNKVVPQITPPAVDVLLRYRWPGNVRELERVMALAVGRARRNAIIASDVIVETRST